MEPDAPRFLTGMPVAPPPVERVRMPAVRPQPPRKLAPLRKPHNTPFEEPERSEEPDGLARYLGPGRMPRLIIRCPRLCGAVMLAIGVYAWVAMVPPRITVSGETVIEWRSRLAPIIAMVGMFVGAFFVVAGRPADSRGFSPGWWNRTYVAVCVVAGLAALVARGT